MEGKAGAVQQVAE
jgi:hypothetical protein